MAKPKQKGIVSGPEDGVTNSAEARDQFEGLEVVALDPPLPQHVIDQLDAAVGRPVGPDDDDDRPVPRLRGVEATILHLKPGTELLVVRLVEVNQRHRAIARFDHKRVGSHEFVSSRAFLASVDASMMGAFEHVHDRSFPYGNQTEAVKRFSPKRVDVDYAVRVVEPSARRQLFVKYRGLWHFVLDWSRHVRRAIDPAVEKAQRNQQRLRRQGAPDISIV